jgi:hypothetical protein
MMASSEAAIATSWRKSTLSVNNGACVEVAPAHDVIIVGNSVIVRDSVMAWVATAGWNHQDSPAIPLNEDEDEDQAPILISASA